jgi:hypothetical protein
LLDVDKLTAILTAREHFGQAKLSFSEGDCTKYQESAALPELAACKAA